MLDFLKSPIVLVGGLVALAWFLLPKGSKWPVGSRWHYTDSFSGAGATWTVFSEDTQGSVTFALDSGEKTDAMPKTLLDRYLSDGTLVPMA